MQLPVTYVWTHDSIGLGEDGPTHQPVEHLAALRAIPGLDVVRPGDANETVAAWKAILENTDRPAGMILTRQNVPDLPARHRRVRHHRRRRPRRLRPARRRGRLARRDPDRHRLRGAARRPGAHACWPRRASAARVVSMPCREWFDSQDQSYRDTGAAAHRQGPGQRRGRHRHGLARPGRPVRPHRLARALRRLGRLRDALPRVRDHRRGGRPGRRGEHHRLAAAERPTATDLHHTDHEAPGRNPMSERLKALADAGVSIWLDDLSRERIETGNLAELVKDSYVVGRDHQPDDLRQRAGQRRAVRRRRSASSSRPGKDVDEAIFAITTTDVRQACDVLADVFEATGGVDGRVSIEVSPGIAHDEKATIEMAKKLWAEVDRENLFIKIPATTEGGPAITVGARRGHQRQRHADLRAGPLRRGHGRLPRGPREGQGGRQGPLEDPLRRVLLRLPGRQRVSTSASRPPATRRPATCMGQAGIANARLAYQAYEKKFAGDRFKALEADGANVQRPLWASTGRQEPGLPRHDVRHRPRGRRTP